MAERNMTALEIVKEIAQIVCYVALTIAGPPGN
jgi:hypothetical protein